MASMFFTAVVSQVVMSLLNVFAPSNMEAMVFTAAVFHLLEALGMAVLYASAPFNMELMSSTKAVSQVEMSLLNAFAPSNMEAMVVTLAVFHLLVAVGMAVLY